MLLLCILNQILLDFQKLAACFEKAIKNNRKTTFEQWFHDLSYKTSVILSLFTVGLLFCIIAPHITFLILIFFCFQLYIDKYNLMYIYPLEFESQLLSRQALVKNSFYAVILFQAVMIGLGALGNGLLSKRATVYLVGLVVI